MNHHYLNRSMCYCCASTVPGNGLSVRYAFFLILKYDFVNVFFIKVDPVYTTICTWLLGYTCSDACARLLLKVIWTLQDKKRNKKEIPIMQQLKTEAHKDA
ncbi:hypothetical protein LXL04_036884 [Taraxacum kok-saghyz]